MGDIARRKILRDDQFLFDGVTRTNSGTDATGGTVTGLNIGDEVDILQVFGSGTSRTAGTINDAVARLGGAEVTFRFTTGTWTIASNVTIPKNVTCYIPSGCTLSASAGITLTISGVIFAGRYQIFGTTGTISLAGFNTAYPQWWGGSPNVADNSSALNYWATSGAQSLHLPAGRYDCDSSAFTALSIPANTMVFGDGMFASQIKFTGTTAKRIFTVDDVSGVSFLDIGLIGNNQAGSYVSDNAIKFQQSGSSAIEGFLVERCYFENFKSDAWVLFYNTGTAALSNGRVKDCLFRSATGNTRDGTLIGVASSMVWFEGKENNTTGIVERCWVTGCSFLAEHVKMSIAIWDGVRDIYIDNVDILDNAKTGINDNVAGYAIIIYDNSEGAGADKPTNIFISNFRINGTRSTGIYGADAVNVYIDNFHINGQTDSTDASLPKGAIALNTCSNVIVSNGRIDDCQFGITGKPVTGTSFKINNVNITGVRSSGHGVKIQAGGGVDTGETYLSNVTILATTTSSRAVFFKTDGTNKIERIELSDCFLNGAFNAFVITTATGTTDVDYLSIADCKFTGTASTHVSIPNLTKYVTLDNVEILSGGDHQGLNIASSTDVHINGLTFRDKTSGSNDMLNATGAQGTLVGVRYVNVATGQRYVATGSNDMGIELPDWTGDEGDWVQNLNIAALDGNNMMLTGWLHDGTSWQPQYVSGVTPAT